MLSDLLWTLILLLFIIPGIRHPYIALCGVVFVDVLKPQTLSFSFLAGKPISLILTIIFFISLIINAKQISTPIKKNSTILLLLFMAWITYTTSEASHPFYAWIKYDYVIKTFLFALFIPFVINNRIKAEAFIATLLISISFFTLTVGLKTLTGGGGYGNTFFISSQQNSGMTESSTMAMVAVMSIPMIYYIKNKSLFSNHIPFLHKISLLLYATSIISIIGTYARTGLIGLLVLLSLILKNSKGKIRNLFYIAVILAIVAPFAPQKWVDRMSTIQSASDDSSAYGRIIVWKWTVDYIKDNPIKGGGFYAFLDNAGVLSNYTDNPDQFIDHATTGKDFHNTFLSIAGGQGLVGLAIFMTILWVTYKSNNKIISTHSRDSWQSEYAIMLNRSLIIFSACGMFISVGYYAWPYYLLGLSTSLHHIINKQIKP